MGVQAAVEDPQIRAVVEGHLLLEDAGQGVVHLRARQEVARGADLAFVVLVGGLVGAGIGEQFEFARVVLDEHEVQHGHVAGDAAEVVGDQRGQRLVAGTERLVHEAAAHVPAGDPRGRAQGVRAEEALAGDLPRDVGQEERSRGRRDCRERGDERDLPQVMAVPVLTGTAAEDAVAEVVVLADDVGVGVVARVVHRLPVVDVHVEVPLVPVGVVLAVVRQVVVTAVHDVVAQLGELNEPVHHLQRGGAPDRARPALPEQLAAPRVDRPPVGGDGADVLQVLLAHGGLGP